MVWLSSVHDMRSGGFIKLVSSLVVVWIIAFLGPSKKSLSDAVANQLAKLPSMQLDWDNADAPWAHYNKTKLALIIDSRPLTTLAPLVLQTMVNVPHDWPFLFLGSTQSIAVVNSSRAIQEKEASGRLRFQTIESDYHSVEGSHRLLANPKFYDEMLPRSVEHLFVFSRDSTICANALRSLDDWLAYDWISGPKNDKNSQAFEGSGGFSLRRVSTVRRILAFQQRDNDTIAEDQFLSYRMTTIPDAVIPNATEASEFVTDHIYHRNSFGIHIGDMSKNMVEVWDNHDRRMEIYHHCPELKMAMTPMKLTREKCDEPKAGEKDS
ncbi:hypothetical protein KCU61_g1549, partial [Aureobasidium melanogenum]